MRATTPRRALSLLLTLALFLTLLPPSARAAGGVPLVSDIGASIRENGLQLRTARSGDTIQMTVGQSVGISLYETETAFGGAYMLCYGFAPGTGDAWSAKPWAPLDASPTDIVKVENTSNDATLTAEKPGTVTISREVGITNVTQGTSNPAQLLAKYEFTLTIMVEEAPPAVCLADESGTLIAHDGEAIKLTVGETVKLHPEIATDADKLKYELVFDNSNGTTDWTAPSGASHISLITNGVYPGTTDTGSCTIKGISVGTTTITRTAGYRAKGSSDKPKIFTITWTVEVASGSTTTLTSVTVTGPTEVEVGQEFTLTAACTPSNLGGVTYEWNIPTTNSLEVKGSTDQPTLTLVAKSQNKITVTAEARYGTQTPVRSNQFTFEIKNPAPTYDFQVAITSDNQNPIVGNSFTLTAKATALTGSVLPANLDYIWSLEDPDAGVVNITTANSNKCTVTVIKEGNFKVNLRVVDRSNSQNFSTATFDKTAALSPFSVTFPSPTRQGKTGDRLTITAQVTGTYSSVTWETSDSSVVEINGDKTTTNSTVTLNLRRPGTATLTATAKSADGRTASAACTIKVSGITIDGTVPDLVVNQTYALPRVLLDGSPVTKVTWKSKDPNTAEITKDGLSVRAVRTGKVTLTVTYGTGGNTYSADLEVVVLGNETRDITARAGVNKPLPFSDILSDLDSECRRLSNGSSIQYMTGLSVTPSQGILHLNYRSPDDTGSGVAATTNYYYGGSTGPKLSDITFVPNAAYTGTEAIIRFNIHAVNGTNLTGRIVVKLDDPEEQNAYLTGTAGQPVKFTSQIFTRACQHATGQSLKYISFSLPAANRGTLYYDYTSPSDYGYKVTGTDQFRVNQCEFLSFVPAEGFRGTVTLSYIGYSTSNSRFVGQIEIEVKQSLDNGPVYNTPQGTHVTFTDSPFNEYSRSMTGRDLDHLQFPSLPDSNQGTLRYNYRSNSSSGTLVTTGTSYYTSGTYRTARINQISFVPARDFTGTVEIPFNAWDKNNNRFSGVIQINVQGSGVGDIYYTCPSNSYVRLNGSDFNSLCRQLTSSSLHHIRFSSLPSTSLGALYTNRSSSGSSGTRVTTGSTYSQSSISNMSYWAANGFTGTIDIPFVGYTGSNENTSEHFSGTLTIEVLSRGQEGYISYTADTKTPAVFQNTDFNDLSIDETGRNLNYVRFDLPASSQGTLYYNYSASSGSYSSKVSSTTNYYRNSGGSLLSRVSFVPAASFTGSASVPFTGYATDGSIFYGTVQILVTPASADATVNYSTGFAPVTFSANDFTRAYTRATLTSLRFTSLPASDEGHLYYQYVSPTQYSWQASTGTDYKVSGSPSISSLTFVPKAGFQGTVTIPYTASCSNNRTYTGQVLIRVSPSSSSLYFTDMNGYSAQAVAAVDYLYENRVVEGVSYDRFAPEQSIRRGDFALMLYRAFQFTAPSNVHAPFTDFSSGDYYARAIDTLWDLGIVNGVGEGRFNPNGTVTRQDAMLMVQRALQTTGWSMGGGSGSLYYYSDRDQVSGYASDAMAAVVQMGLLPTDGGYLNPKSPLVRVDMAQVLHRSLTY